MKEQIQKRVEALRGLMSREGLDAFIIPSFDQHLSEYTPEVWQHRQWISGFYGSAGTVVVTHKGAYLWTDSRYYLQAASDLEGTPFSLMKEGMPDTPGIVEFLRNEGSVKKVGLFGRSVSAKEALTTRRGLSVAGIDLVTDTDLAGELIGNEKQIPLNPLFAQPLDLAGKSTKEKIKEVREALKAEGANTIPLTMLDEVAWLFNVRGTDVEYNPVGIAYGLITPDEVFFYAFPEKVPAELRTELERSDVQIRPYGQIYDDIKALPKSAVVWTDPLRTNYALYASIPDGITKIEASSPITLLKAQKNEAEYAGCVKVMHRDGVALTRFFIWLEKTLKEGGTPTEHDLDEKLASFRAKGEGYVSDSFATIAGYKDHGAIVHYHATPDIAYKVRREGMLLLDSGAQYHDGTTDITRTISLDGKPTEGQKHDYTNVLKGHIGIATAIFPEGTRGSQLDILARRFLWQEGKLYTHGTGHGVGHFLNVHEGPQNIRLEENSTPLMPGMVTSNEPGYYLEGQYGIRIENLVRTVFKMRGADDPIDFYGFETLTLCYLDNNLVNVSMLTDDELEWYNAYQERVFKELSPLLEKDESEWLRNKTLPLAR